VRPRYGKTSLCFLASLRAAVRLRYGKTGLCFLASLRRAKPASLCCEPYARGRESLSLSLCGA